jgi:hypothetical protein
VVTRQNQRSKRQAPDRSRWRTAARYDAVDCKEQAGG